MQAEILVRSIKEYTVVTPEMGRYFDTPKAGYAWNGYRIDTGWSRHGGYSVCGEG